VPYQDSCGLSRKSADCIKLLPSYIALPESLESSQDSFTNHPANRSSTKVKVVAMVDRQAVDEHST
jgi:hypothetical protein